MPYLYIWVSAKLYLERVVTWNEEWQTNWGDSVVRMFCLLFPALLPSEPFIPLLSHVWANTSDKCLYFYNNFSSPFHLFKYLFLPFSCITPTPLLKPLVTPHKYGSCVVSWKKYQKDQGQVFFFFFYCFFFLFYYVHCRRSVP